VRGAGGVRILVLQRLLAGKKVACLLPEPETYSGSVENFIALIPTHIPSLQPTLSREARFIGGANSFKLALYEG
jgi:hypothetical protein